MMITWPEAFPGAHWLDEEEERAVLDVLRNGSLFRFYGLNRPRHVEALEGAACRFYGVRHALAVNSGTGALFTAMTALGIGPGCEVIVPSFFWVATVGAVVQANAVPVLCEVDESLTLAPDDLEAKITDRTRLIVAVHMAGAPCRMDAIMAVADRHGIPVLEDCAQANGATFRGQKVGTFGTLGMFSFQINKNVTSGEGGLLVTDDAGLYERCVAAHDLGIPWVDGLPCETRPESVVWGGGRRMSELCGAVAAVQLAKLPQIIERMRGSRRRIETRLSGTPGLRFRASNDPEGDTGPFLVLLLDDEARAVRAAARLAGVGLTGAVRIADYGMHIYSNVPQLVRKVSLSPAGNPWSLPQNKDLVRDYARGACPASDALFARSILIPIPSRLTAEQEEQAAELIKSSVSA
jgi:dTDP-4-amino-4,6-dideoxygalactose transaminase